MPQLTIPDDTFDRLTRRAAATGTTIEALALPALEQLAAAPPTVELPDDEWKRRFDDLTRLIRSRADRYPPRLPRR